MIQYYSVKQKHASNKPSSRVQKGYSRSYLKIIRIRYQGPHSSVVYNIIFKFKTVLSFSSFYLKPLIYSPSQLFFKWLDTCTSMPTTPTFITEALCLIA